MQGGGGVAGRHPVSIILKMIRAADNQMVLLNEDIFYLQIGLILFHHYKNANKGDNVTTSRVSILSVTQNLIAEV